MANLALTTAIHKFALAGERAGFTLEEMIGLLNDGMSVEKLLVLVKLRLLIQEGDEPTSARRSSGKVM